MCGRYTFTSGLTILQRRFSFAAEQLILRLAHQLRVAGVDVKPFSIDGENGDADRARFENGGQTRLALAQGLLRPLALGDVGHDADDAALGGRRLVSLEDAVTDRFSGLGAPGLAKLPKSLIEAQYVRVEIARRA